MLLDDKVALVYGGSGAIGGAAARAFAGEGARVVVTGLTPVKIDAVVTAVEGAGGTAVGTVTDALDEGSVEAAADLAVDTWGRIDVCLTAVGLDNGDQGIALTELSAEAYLRPIQEYALAHFLTARAAANRMTAAGGGVVIPVSAPMARVGTALTGSFAPAHAAVETMARQIAGELGQQGVRVVPLRPNGMPNSVRDHDSHTARVWGRAAERFGISLEEMLPEVGGGGFLGRELTVEDLADLAVLVASDRASALTGTVLNATGGAVPD